MAYLRIESSFRTLSDEELRAWRTVPTCVASDCMNRTQAVHADIKSVKEGSRICGQARTVTAMVGDGGAVHAALEEANPGEILVVSAGGAKNVAIWGGLGHAAAQRHGIGGLVIDGAVRDVAEIRASGLPCFCRSITPRGPHMQFGGTYGGATAIGDVPVNPGDLVLGDDDGVVIVPLAWAEKVLELALEHLEQEKLWLQELDRGNTICRMFDVPKATTLSFDGSD